MARKHFLPLIDSGLDYSGEGDNATLTGTTASTDFPPSMLEESFQHLPMTALGETRYWVATSAGNTNDTANWGLAPGSSGGASIPTIENTVYFTADAGGDCTFNSSLTCKGWIIDGYTGTIAQGAYNLTVGTSTTSNGISQNSGTWTKTTGEIDHYGRWSPTGGTFNGGSGRINFTAFQAGVRCDFVATGGTYTDTSGNHYTRGGAGDQGEWNVGAGCTYDANGGTQWPYAMMNIAMASGKLFGTLRAAGGCVMKSDLYGVHYDAGSGALESDVATPYKVSVTGNLYIPYSDSSTNRPNYEATGSGAQAIKAGFGNYLIINKTAGAVTIANQDGGYTGAVVKFVVTAIGTGSIDGTSWLLNGIGNVVQIDTSAVPGFDLQLGVLAASAYQLVGTCTFNGNFTQGGISAYNLFVGTKTTVKGTTSISGANASGTELRIEGNLLLENQTRTGSISTLTIAGSGAQSIKFLGTGIFNTITGSNTGAVASLSATSNTNLAGSDMVWTSGTLDVAGFNLTVTDQFQIASGATLKAKGTETLTATGKTFDAASTTEFYSAAADVLVNNISTSFGNISHTAVDQINKFTAGSTTTITGAWTIVGTLANPTTFKSTIDNNAWNVDRTAGSSAFTNGLIVKDSHSVGIILAKGSVDQGNNINWIFAGGASLEMLGLHPYSPMGALGGN